MVIKRKHDLRPPTSNEYLPKAVLILLCYFSFVRHGLMQPRLALNYRHKLPHQAYIILKKIKSLTVILAKAVPTMK